MQKYCLKETCHIYEAEKDLDYCPNCKSKLEINCPKCQKPLDSYNKAQSYGCKHCGQMFKSVHRT